MNSLPVTLKHHKNPQTLPEALLPFLAKELSVDFWSDDWDVQKKRLIIAASIEAHKHKGTLHAVQTALAAINTEIEIVEWFDQTPTGTPNTIDINILSKEGLSESVTDDIKDILDATKPLHVHYSVTFKILTNQLIKLTSVGLFQQFLSLEGSIA